MQSLKNSVEVIEKEEQESQDERWCNLFSEGGTLINFNGWYFYYIYFLLISIMSSHKIIFKNNAWSNKIRNWKKFRS